MIGSAARPEIRRHCCHSLTGLRCHLTLFTIICSIHDLQHTSFHIKTCCKTVFTDISNFKIYVTLHSELHAYLLLLYLASSEKLFVIVKNCSSYAMIYATGIENDKISLRLRTEKYNPSFLGFAQWLQDTQLAASLHKAKPRRALRKPPI